MSHSPYWETARRWMLSRMPDGREIVKSLVIQGERFSRNPTSSTDENVFRRLRERLGLAGSRNQSTRGSSTRS